MLDLVRGNFYFKFFFILKKDILEELLCFLKFNYLKMFFNYKLVNYGKYYSYVINNYF